MGEARLNLIYELMHQKTATARAYVQYIDSDREYVAGASCICGKLTF